ncbi:TPA: hypothetical protein R4057_001921 [Kluyvera ascorbata]|nr:hypothetical protein [Kluyvera ascorbata]
MTDTKERGMIFNSEMVRAILEGRKTQTRRIMQVQPPKSEDFFGSSFGLCRAVHPDVRMVSLNQYDRLKKHPTDWDLDGSVGVARNAGFPMVYRCPFGSVGDRIWGRETWGVVSHELDEDGRIQPWTPDRPATPIHEMPFGNGYYSGHAIYAADGEFTWGDDDGYEDGRSCWKPSIHMPRAACRILLEITDVRVERLNDISREDAIAEGGTPYFNVDWFSGLWASIYGEESWTANPWVWVIEFKRLEGGDA